MKKYARGNGRRGIDSFVGKVAEFRKYLSERRGFVEWNDKLLEEYYAMAAGEAATTQERSEDDVSSADQGVSIPTLGTFA